MLVSVLIPVYSNPQLLPRALRSVASGGLGPGVEVVVINDGAGESCRAVLSQLEEFDNWLYVETKNRGLAAARNAGVSVARGDWIVPLDDDDELEGAYLREVCALARSGSDEFNLVAPRIRIVQSKGVVEWGGSEWTSEDIAVRNLLPYCSAFRKDVWQSVAGYREALEGYEDWDFWLRARRLIRPFVYDGVGLVYHRSESGLLSRVQSRDLQLRAQLVLGSTEAFSDEEVLAAGQVVRGEWSVHDVPKYGIFGRSTVVRDHLRGL